MSTGSTAKRYAVSAQNAPRFTSLMFALEPRYAFDGAMAETIGDSFADVPSKAQDMFDVGPSHRAMFTLVESLLDGDATSGAEATPAPVKSETQTELPVCEEAPPLWVTFEVPTADKLMPFVSEELTGVETCSIAPVETVAVDAPAPVEAPSTLVICYAPEVETVAVEPPSMDHVMLGIVEEAAETKPNFAPALEPVSIEQLPTHEPMPQIADKQREPEICTAAPVEIVIDETHLMDELMAPIADKQRQPEICIAAPVEIVIDEQRPADPMMQLVGEQPSVLAICYAPEPETVVVEQPPLDELLPDVVEVPIASPTIKSAEPSVVSHTPVAGQASTPADLFKDWLKKYRSTLLR
jgi:hypothetical protein